MNILSLCNRPVLPTNWTTWTTIPWNDPGFSARMLENHLSQEHDWASRTASIIEAHVSHIHSLLPQGATILDLGCGPGLYTEKLSRLGHRCPGVDFSPASIEYAKQQPEAGHINYIPSGICPKTGKPYLPAFFLNARICFWKNISGTKRWRRA